MFPRLKVAAKVVGDLAKAQQRPGDARVLVGQRHRRHVVTAFGLQPL